MKNGVNPVDLLGIVHKLQSTEGTCLLPCQGVELGVNILALLGEDMRLHAL
jgi:hypothetical protein